MAYTLTIVNSFVYIYGDETLKQYQKEICRIAGNCSSINTRSDKLLLHIRYQNTKEINEPEDIIKYINDFASHVDDVIDEIMEKVGVDIRYHSLSNIVFSGSLKIVEDVETLNRLLENRQKLATDLYKIGMELKSKYKERIHYIGKPKSNGNEFPGLIVTFYIDPTKLNRKGKVVKKRNRTTIILYSNGKFIWTGVNDNLYTDPEKVAYFHNVIEFIRERAKKYFLEEDKSVKLDEIPI